MSVTTYDRYAFGRSLAIGCGLAVLAYGIMLATDGATTSTAGKLARLGVLAPVLGTLGSALANAQARSRGEVRALVSSGVSPGRCYAGPMIAAVLLGIAGVAILGSGATDLGGLFPRLEHDDWIRFADGSWRSARAGILVATDGTMTIARTQVAVTPQPWPSRAAVMLTVLLSSAALPIWVERGGPLKERLGIGALSVVLGVVLFHLVGTGQVSAWCLVAVPATIAFHTAVRSTVRTNRRGG